MHVDYALDCRYASDFRDSHDGSHLFGQSVAHKLCALSSRIYKFLLTMP